MKKNTVSIIIPCRNEGEGLSRIIRSVKKYSDEVIVVDAHSKDNSREIAKSEGASFFLDHGLGRGDAVRIGIKKAKGDVLIFFDADGSHDPRDIPKIIDLIKRDKADIVTCSRRTGGSFDMDMNFNGLFRSVGSDLLTYMVNYKFKTNLTDVLYSFRGIKRSDALKLKLNSDTFTIEQEMIVKSLKNKLRLVEIPSRESRRGWGKSKLGTLTGIQFIFHLFSELYLN